MHQIQGLTTLATTKNMYINLLNFLDMIATLLDI